MQLNTSAWNRCTNWKNHGITSSRKYLPDHVAEHELELHLISRKLIKCLHHTALQWRPNGRGSVSNHQPHDCLLNRLFRLRSKKASKLRVTGLCVGNSPVTGEFPPQMASNAENVSIWWRHHATNFNWEEHIYIHQDVILAVLSLD